MKVLIKNKDVYSQRKYDEGTIKHIFFVKRIVTYFFKIQLLPNKDAVKYLYTTKNK